MSDELNNGQTPEQAPGTAPDTGAQEAQTPPSYEQQGQNYGNPYYGGQEKMTGILDAYKSYWRNYVNFNDRTSRAGYWWVVLINYVISIVLCAVFLGPAMAALAMAFTNPLYVTATVGTMFAGAGAIFLIWELANFLPALAIIVRRLHDINKRWTNIFFLLIPIAGAIIFLVFMLTGTKYPPTNRFYDQPKQG
jgi:uncharacterized membrane protein YhaH (DUF805 family)